MKSELIEVEAGKTQDKYPYIGVSPCSGRVILFTRATTGVLIHAPNEPCDIGKHSNTWAEGNFEPLTGKIILEN